ncbi:fimbrial protein [Legionella longbeachae]|uniref:fimbrial protein n=1 Tax=Legionella longbeachae TaxID=450 RepID=UPI0009B72E80|nr:fimbrial protein [Legionella longbeachae]VEE02711.1 putative fimbrial protein precursor-like protein [Legionella oakridgensis]
MSLVEPLQNKVSSWIQGWPIKTILFFSIYFIARLCFAEDALVDAEPVIKDTYNGSLKTYLYVGEAVAAIVTLIFTRNIKHLGGVLLLAVFLNIVARLAGFI